jgi:hypothetical protein
MTGGCLLPVLCYIAFCLFMDWVVRWLLHLAPSSSLSLFFGVPLLAAGIGAVIGSMIGRTIATRFTKSDCHPRQ